MKFFFFPVVTALCISLPILADDVEKVLFQTDFKNASGTFESAPLLPITTQPAKDRPTVDFNNLKDPKFTTVFELRSQIKNQVPGFSSCFINRYGSMEVNCKPEDGYVRLHGENLKVEGYIGKRFLTDSPTSIEATVQRLDPAEGGKVFLRVGDFITGAYVTLAWLDGKNAAGSWAVAYNTTDAWDGWKEIPSPKNLDVTKPVTLKISLTSDNQIQCFVNGLPIGTAITLPNLNRLSELRIGADARVQGVDILGVTALRNEAIASKKEDVLELQARLKDAAQLKATNPYGSGIQIDYPFLGFSQAMEDPELFEELAQILRDLNVKLIRFPGGNSTYFYSIHGPEAMKALQDMTGYFMLDQTQYKWVDTKQLFRLCKAIGADCVYELNLGYWYDPKAKKLYRIGVQDTGLITWPPPTDDSYSLQGPVKPLEYHCEKLKDAAEDTKQIVSWAKDAGVNVIWEFGNEDTAYYSPKTHVDICKAFYDAFRQADPNAQFMIYGDGYSWSDLRWPMAVFEEMAKQKMDIAYTSHHIYMFAGTGIPLDNGQRAYDGLTAAWRNIQELHYDVRTKLDELGYKDTKLAMTEGNMASTGPMVSKPFEHGMGRALGEAETFGDRIRRYSMWIYHDLVHNGSCDSDGSGGWFARIYYHPENPKGKRYSLPLDSVVMSVVNEHASRDIILDDRCVTASQWTDGVLLTAGNPHSTPLNVCVRFDGKGLSAQETNVTCIKAENLDAPFYTTQTWAVTPAAEENGSIAVNLTIPPYSFCHLRIKAEEPAAK